MLNFQKQQAHFAAHLRNPENPAPADVEDRRMAIYRDLFFNNIESFIAGVFPVFKSLFEADDWRALVRDFMSGHACQSPYFLEISQSFLEWLDNDRLAVHQGKPFARELCHYEWVELALDVADVYIPAFDANGDLMHQAPLVSPLAWPLLYRWPVHLIGPDHQPQQPAEQPTCLIVYRNRADNIGFIESSPATLRLLELLDQQPELSGHQALEHIADELPGADPQAVLAFGRGQLALLHEQGVILGSRC